MDLEFQTGHGFSCLPSYLTSLLVNERVQPEDIVFYYALASPGLSFPHLHNGTNSTAHFPQ